MTKLSEGIPDKNEGFDSLRRIFTELDIDITEWVSKPITKERGGLEFMLPSAEGEIYLEWSDLFRVNVTFVQTKKVYDETLTQLGDLYEIIKTLENQRKSFIGGLRDMLFREFSKEEE